MKKLLMMAAVLFAFASSQAFAESDQVGDDIRYDGGQSRDFDKSDKNRGGGKFQEADKNGDGVISRDEFMKKHEARVKRQFEKMDMNGDGELSKDEIKTGRQKMHEKMKSKMQDHRQKHQKRRDSRDSD